jgi:hypothetical protein
MNSVVSSGIRPLRTVFAWPIALCVTTAVGLACALIGDGVWDAISWILLVTPVAVALWYGGQSWRARTRTRTQLKTRLNSESTFRAPP